MKNLFYDVTAKANGPKWYELRKRLSDFFLRLAKRLYPESPNIKAFFVKQYVDAMIYGGSITRVDPAEWHNVPKSQEEYGRSVGSERDSDTK